MRKGAARSPAACDAVALRGTRAPAGSPAIEADRRNDVIRLIDNESGKPIDTISEAQLKALVDQLEEEATDDQDYYIDGATLDWFDDEGVDPALTALLRKALGSREGMEIRWTKE
jgi:hypothetical protein